MSEGNRRGSRAGWRFEDLDVFKRAYGLSLELHRASLDFPRSEQFGGIADQLRRSSKSVCALIAEGSARQRSSSREFRRYLVMALGSADETKLWCRYAHDLGYLPVSTMEAWQEHYGEVARMLQGFIARLD
jgi:four helix bundle protein